MRNLAIFVSIAVLVPAVASAQFPRFELSLLGGWTLSDGVRFPGTDVGGERFTSIGADDSFAFGAGAAYSIDGNTNLGFVWNRQVSTLVADGTISMDIDDFNVDTFHGVVDYTFGRPWDKMRAFVLGGMGVTHFGGVEFSADGERFSTGGQSKFSTTWGVGVKIYPHEVLGIRLSMQWTPTYVRSDPGGYWCDPYWGCGTVRDPEYSNQLTFGGAVTARFGD